MTVSGGRELTDLSWPCLLALSKRKPIAKVLKSEPEGPLRKPEALTARMWSGRQQEYLLLTSAFTKKI